MSSGKGQAFVALSSVPSAKKILSRDDAVDLLTYLQCGEFLLNGQNMDRFVEIKRKVAIMAAGAVQYIPQEVACSPVQGEPARGAEPVDADAGAPHAENGARGEPDAAEEA